MAVATPAIGIANVNARCRPFMYAASIPGSWAGGKLFWTSVAPRIIMDAGSSPGLV